MLQRYREDTATSILLERDISGKAENLKLQIEIFVLGTRRKTKSKSKNENKKSPIGHEIMANFIYSENAHACSYQHIQYRRKKFFDNGSES